MKESVYQTILQTTITRFPQLNGVNNACQTGTTITQLSARHFWQSVWLNSHPRPPVNCNAMCIKGTFNPVHRVFCFWVCWHWKKFRENHSLHQSPSGSKKNLSTYTFTLIRYTYYVTKPTPVSFFTRFWNNTVHPYTFFPPPAQKTPPRVQLITQIHKPAREESADDWSGKILWISSKGEHRENHFHHKLKSLSAAPWYGHPSTKPQTTRIWKLLILFLKTVLIF